MRDSSGKEGVDGRDKGECEPTASVEAKPTGMTARQPEHPVGEGTPELPGSGHVQFQASEYIDVSTGPLPPPTFVRSYEDTLPGAADRILTITEKQQDHRHSMESARLQNEITLQQRDLAFVTRGQWMGFVFGILALFGAVLLVIVGQSLEGLTAMLLPVATIIGIFTMSKRIRPRAAQPEADDDDPAPPPKLPNGPE